jgi:hypothetical protein
MRFDVQNRQSWLILSLYPVVSVLASLVQVGVGYSSFYSLSAESLGTSLLINAVVSLICFRWIATQNTRFVAVISFLYLAMPLLIRGVLFVAIKVPFDVNSVILPTLIGALWGIPQSILTLLISGTLTRNESEGRA